MSAFRGGPTSTQKQCAHTSRGGLSRCTKAALLEGGLCWVHDPKGQGSRPQNEWNRPTEHRTAVTR